MEIETKKRKHESVCRSRTTSDIRSLWFFSFKIKRDIVEKNIKDFDSYIVSLGEGFNEKILNYAFFTLDNCEDLEYFNINGRVNFKKGIPLEKMKELFPKAKLCPIYDSFYYDQKNRVDGPWIFGEVPKKIMNCIRTKICIPPFEGQTIDILSFFSGFFDGDGCIQFTSEKKSTFRISISQSGIETPDILIAFKKYFDYGYITLNKKSWKSSEIRTFDENDELDEIIKFINSAVIDKSLKNNIQKKLELIKNNVKFQWKPEWEWCIRKEKESQDFIEKIAPFCLIKKPQLDFAIENLNSKDYPNRSTIDQDKIRTKLSSMKRLENYQKVEINSEMISYPYLAGITDAEGCITVIKDRYDLMISIGQKSSPKLLQEVKKKLGYGNISGYSYNIICSKNVFYSFGPMIRCFLIQKRDQMELILQEDSKEWRSKIYRLLQIIKKA